MLLVSDISTRISGDFTCILIVEGTRTFEAQLGKVAHTDSEDRCLLEARTLRASLIG